MDKRLIKRLSILVIFLAVLFGGIFGWHAYIASKTGAAMSKAGKQRVTVSAVPVKRMQWSSELQVTASLKAVQGTMLTPQLPGMVTTIKFNSGAQVTKDQLLIQLNDATQQAQLHHDLSTLDLDKTKLAQQKTLYRRHNTSQLSLQEAKTAYAQAQSAVSSDRATLAKLQVRAAFDGHVGLRQVSLGQYVQTTTPVVDLQKWNPIYAVFLVPQQELARLAVKQQVRLQVPGLGKRTFKGQLTAIGAQVQSGTRNVRVQATLDNPGDALRPGMFGRITVRTGQGSSVLAIPDSAISYNTYGQYVYVVEHGKHGTEVKERNVQTGDSRNGLTVISKGLKANEKVVTAGQVKLHPGAAVTIAKNAGNKAHGKDGQASGGGA
jgi:membrane fusion protein (multidrug efflux system)